MDLARPGLPRLLPSAARGEAFLRVPAGGCLCYASPDKECESVAIGLCRHAGLPGWRRERFCKTQYASRHGWEHFLRCHLAVVRQLMAAESAGLRVTVADEGGLWGSGSFAVLRRYLARYDEDNAALGGALNDAAEAVGRTIDAPIFPPPQFQHLEAKGLATPRLKAGRIAAKFGRKLL